MLEYILVYFSREVETRVLNRPNADVYETVIDVFMTLHDCKPCSGNKKSI